MTITFYKTLSDKIRTEKTLTPVFTGVADPIPPSSMLHPDIYITQTTENSIFPECNYAFIHDYNRYYFIANATWVNDNVWSAHLDVDVLMTYKENIYNLEAFVARSESQYDTFINDPYAPSEEKHNYTYNILTLQSYYNASGDWIGFENALATDNTYRVVVALNIGAYKFRLSNDPLPVDSDWVAPSTPYLYIVLTMTEYYRLINTVKRLGSSNVAGLTGYSQFTGIISDAYVLPYVPQMSSYKVSRIGLWQTTNLDPSSWDGLLDIELFVDAYVLVESGISEFCWSCDLTLPNNLPYQNTSPYVTYTLTKYPLGSVTLDGSVLNKNGRYVKLLLYCKCEALTGQCIFYYGIAEYGSNVSIEDARVLCVLPLGQTFIKVPYAYLSVTNSNMTLSQHISQLADVVGGAENAIASGGAPSAMLNAWATFGEAYLSPKVPSYSVAGNPNTPIITAGAELLVNYVKPVAIPYDIVGRPLYKKKLLSDLSGFTIVKDVHVHGFYAFDEELNEIESLLKSGVILGPEGV